jgi:hypothetical protein
MPDMSKNINIMILWDIGYYNIYYIKAYFDIIRMLSNDLYFGEILNYLKYIFTNILFKLVDLLIYVIMRKTKS